MDELLREIQLSMLDILKVFDDICVKNQINYSLAGGTLLGAIRHQGFIPWDDDLDVFMTRQDFNRFVTSWDSKHPEGYFLQTKETEEEYTRGFAKIRKEHTLFLQENENPERVHTGIFIDVFPVDRVPNGGIKSFFFYWDCVQYQLYTREFVPPKGNFIVKLISGFLLKTTSHKRRMLKREKLLKRITRYNDISSLGFSLLETPWHFRHVFPSDLFTSYCNVRFEDREYKCISKYKELLENLYGDYLQLPAEKDRVWAHHPQAVDLEHNYREYIEKKDILS